MVTAPRTLTGVIQANRIGTDSLMALSWDQQMTLYIEAAGLSILSSSPFSFILFSVFRQNLLFSCVFFLRWKRVDKDVEGNEMGVRIITKSSDHHRTNIQNIYKVSIQKCITVCFLRAYGWHSVTVIKSH